ncbi:GntR family transcriptional regulator [Kitasatospora sp. DSM 101779]|uniref:GntR family transcriptional regulator n=1 Tax=Kitasatospora sp. DSM 101779 TaxID=2853165 RepID=UPI002955C888|nr:GntR family transcriptional regulator [Kitasatospora sp. DSM 101779]MCU7823729.1 GntR family transcriptional regulator [Kitasatospora sp. DSM 101779]
MYGTGAARPPIQRNSLREQIADALREEMMAGRLAAGRNFTVKEIADLYGVSATPAREAMVDLAAQGLLRAEHHRGFTVPEFTWRDFLEIFEARTLLTDSAMRRLTAHPARGSGGYDWSRMPSLRRRADAAARASRQGQLDVLVGCDLRFWQEAAALLGNARIAEYLGWLRVQSWMFAAPHLRQAGDLRGVCWDRHGDLVDRIEARDLSGAHRVVNEYNLFTLELLARLAGEEADAVPVAALLRAPAAGAAAAGPVPAPAAPAAVPDEATRVPLPRSVPPGRFGRPVRPSGPVPGGTSPS